MGDFTDSDRDLLMETRGLAQSTHDSIIDFNRWRIDHENAHLADTKAYLKVLEVQQVDIGKHSEEIKSLNRRYFYAIGILGGAIGLIAILDKIGVL